MKKRKYYCCPVKLKITYLSCSKPFIIRLRAFFFKKQVPLNQNANRSLEIFPCKKSDYSRLCHRYSICMLTRYASFVLLQDKMQAKFSNDRFGINYRGRLLKRLRHEPVAAVVDAHAQEITVEVQYVRVTTIAGMRT